MTSIPLIHNIAAILPAYTEHGDQTRIICNNGKTVDLDKTLPAVLKAFAKLSSTNLSFLRQRTSSIAHCKLMPPLPLAADLILFPVKVRKPRIPHDVCIGYINLFAFKSAVPCPYEPSHSIIILANGKTIKCLWTKATVIQHLTHAQLAAGCWLQNQNMLAETSAQYTAKVNAVAQMLVAMMEIIKK